MANDIFGVLRPSLPGPQKTIIVLGTPRGGTSMVAATLRKLGVMMGEQLGHQHEDRSFRRDVPIETMIETIQKRDAAHDVWGWKMPNSVYYVENLLPHLRNPHFVAVFRNPFSISRSSAERDSRDFNLRLLQVAANHTKRVVDLLEKLEAPAALVCFESAVRQPETFVSNLAEFIGVEVGEVTATEVSQSAIQPGKGYLEF